MSPRGAGAGAIKQNGGTKPTGFPWGPAGPAAARGWSHRRTGWPAAPARDRRLLGGQTSKGKLFSERETEAALGKHGKSAGGVGGPRGSGGAERRRLRPLGRGPPAAAWPRRQAFVSASLVWVGLLGFVVLCYCLFCLASAGPRGVEVQPAFARRNFSGNSICFKVIEAILSHPSLSQPSKFLI